METESPENDEKFASIPEDKMNVLFNFEQFWSQNDTKLKLWLS